MDQKYFYFVNKQSTSILNIKTYLTILSFETIPCHRWISIEIICCIKNIFNVYYFNSTPNDKTPL